MRPVVLTKSLAAADPDNIAQSQALSAAGDLTLDGVAVVDGIAVLDTQRRLLFTSGGNDSGISFTAYGTNDAGVAISETVTGANAATIATQQDFKTVTRVAASGAVATVVEVGTNDVGSTRWAVPSNSTAFPSIGIQADLLSGTATFSIETTGDDPKAPIPIYQEGFDASVAIPAPFAAAGLGGLMASAQGSITTPVAGWRLTITSGQGEVRAVGIQQGLGSA